jgi:1,4-dihydroxy-2-naphthoate polyprenyltransferase
MGKAPLIWQYFKMIRPLIVAGGILAFTLGALIGIANGGAFNPLRFVLFYATVFFGDLSTHFSNDYFDAQQDKFSERKKFFSGNKILTANPNMLPRTQKLSIALLSISLGSAALAVIFKIAPIELLLIMAGANFLGWFYSAPPLRFVSRGLGEVAIALAVGFAIPAAGYLSVNGHLDSWYGFFFLPFVLYALMLALSLEAPDIDADRMGNKKTFGVVYGVRAVFRLILALASAAFAMFLFYGMQIKVASISFGFVGALAAVPLIAGIFGLIGVQKRKSIQTFSAVSVCSLIFFNVFMITYLLILKF